MATTVDFKLDSMEEAQATSTPNKRKLIDLTYVVPDELVNSTSSILIASQISPEITSPEYKKRNVIDGNDLDPKSDVTLTGSRVNDTTITESIGNDTTLLSTQANDNDTTLMSTQPYPPHTNTSQSQLLFTDDSQQSALNHTDLLQPTALMRLHSRRHSDPAMGREGGTLSQIEVKGDNSEMMNVLLDIRSRIHNLEIKGSDMVTNESLKQAITEIQTPMQETINALETSVQKHETILTTMENARLALQNRISLVDQELKNHIDTTSAEYGELKIAHSESTDHVHAKIANCQEAVCKNNETWEENYKVMQSQLRQMDLRLNEQDTQNKKIKEMLSNAQETFLSTSRDANPSLLDPMRRTHLDDMMRRSVIIEGIQENRGEDLVELILEISDALDIELYAGEISQARRIGRYKTGIHSRPIKVTFIGEIKRDRFLQRKKHLANTDKFNRVIIFPDDKPEVRKFKAHLRMAANIARKRGDQVWQRYNAIVVNGKKYEYRNYTELAIDFPWPGDVRYTTPLTSTSDPTAPKTLETLRRERTENQPGSVSSGAAEDNNMETEILLPNSKGAPRQISKCRKLNNEEVQEMIDSLGSHRCVQITSFGIGFYTGECILSNHYKVKFTYNGRDHTSSEQAYFAECAIAAKDPVSLKQIMETNSPRRAKEIGEKITPGPTWKYIKYDRMYDINLARFSQNDFLKERLLSTRGFTLIEASTNMEWASGSSLHSVAMSKGTWRGDNRHGFQLVDIREELYRSAQAVLLCAQSTTV